MTAHEIHGLSGAYAVDALDPEERERFEAHLAVCEDCRAEVAGLQEAAALLGDLSATTPSPALRDRVLADISTVRPLPPPVSDSVDSWAARRRPRWVDAVAAAAAAVAFFGGGAAVWQARIAREQRDAARLEARNSDAVVDFLTGVFAGADPANTDGRDPPASELLANGVNGIDAQTVDTVAIEPEQRIRDEKVDDLRASVIVDQRAPILMPPLQRVRVLVQCGAVEQAEAVRIVRKMSGHPVEQHTEPLAMAGVDEMGEVGGRAEAAGRRVQAGRLISP